MSVEIIDGKLIASQIQKEIADEILQLKSRSINPGLAVILVGDNPSSQSYVSGKTKDCKQVGIHSVTINLPKDISQEKLHEVIDELNKDNTYHGILVQLPLPEHLSERMAINKIIPEKDVDGLHPFSMGMLLADEPTFLPCTPAGIQQMLLRTNNDPQGKHVVIVGRSNIVGKPLSLLLSSKSKGGNASVTICHSKTPNIEYFTKQADILIAAVGKAHIISKEMIKKGAVVIDVGVNSVEDKNSKKGYKLVGDVDFEGALEVVKAITPVPGGVGPMTRTMLLINTVKSAKQFNKI